MEGGRGESWVITHTHTHTHTHTRGLGPGFREKRGEERPLPPRPWQNTSLEGNIPQGVGCFSKAAAHLCWEGPAGSYLPALLFLQLGKPRPRGGKGLAHSTWASHAGDSAGTSSCGRSRRGARPRQVLSLLPQPPFSPPHAWLLRQTHRLISPFPELRTPRFSPRPESHARHSLSSLFASPGRKPLASAPWDPLPG